MPAPGTAAHENAEKAVTGAAAAEAQAAAVKAAGGGTAGKVTTDCTGTGYEVTVTKSDGSTVEIHLDSAFHTLPAPDHAPGAWGALPPSGSTG
jgi:ferric-dicitrate binding protein FerR (iron transport regulator)